VNLPSSCLFTITGPSGNSMDALSAHLYRCVSRSALLSKVAALQAEHLKAFPDMA
jgi:hypothetical protein